MSSTETMRSSPVPPPPPPNYPPPQLNNQFLGLQRQMSSGTLDPRMFFTPQFSGYNMQFSGYKTDNAMRCYNCDGVGHLSRDCKQPRACFICGEAGHVARQCNFNPTKPTIQTSSGSEVDSTSGEVSTNNDVDHEVCLNCNEKGHRVKSCPHPKKCFLCNNPGHVARDCPQSVSVKHRAQQANSPAVNPMQMYNQYGQVQASMMPQQFVYYSYNGQILYAAVPPVGYPQSQAQPQQPNYTEGKSRSVQSHDIGSAVAMMSNLNLKDSL